MPDGVVDLESTPVSTEEAHAEVELVLRSPTFDRSERLQKFLRYICELTLSGEAARINEYLIGSEVFHKGADYNPGEDSIVRRQAHALRKKLQDYYAGEGKDRPIRIELPVGRYVPAFRRLEQAILPSGPPAVAETDAAALSQPSLPAVKFQRGLQWNWILPLGAIALFAAGAIVGGLWKSTRPAVSPPSRIGLAAKEIWGAWLATSSQAVICLSNPNATWVKRLEHVPDPTSIPQRFPVHTSAEPILRDALRLPPGGRIYFTPSTNTAKMGEAVAGVFLGQFLGAAGKPVGVTQSRFLNWEDLRRQNLILLGNNESNQWVDPFLKKYPFRLGNTAANEPRSIVNTQPVQGEQAVYRIAYSGTNNEADQEYALVSMVSGLEKGTQLLLIDGLNTQATQMAAEYLTTESSLSELAGRLHTLDPRHQGPWRFQAVLKTEVYDNVPTRAVLVTVRVLK